MIKTKDIHIRDPFILPVESEKKYYLYGTTGMSDLLSTGFYTYVSEDLENWEGPYQVFQLEKNFWGIKDFWAPEVYFYKGKFYMCASFKAEGKRRGTHILIAERPQGPFIPLCEQTSTPENWECLDGTLYIDENQTPWMVFCHEWLQVADGRMCAIRLNSDLSKIESEPLYLFSASMAPWARSLKPRLFSGIEKACFITDGPFLYRLENGLLIMLWSSHGEKGYSIGIARSDNGEITGKWKHDEKPLNLNMGGHGMLFKSFEGELMLTIHSPNLKPDERVVFYKVKIENGSVSIYSQT